MIKRFPGSVPTRSGTVVHHGLAYTVATSPNKSVGMYEQTREALAAIDNKLKAAGTDKSRILTAIVYIANMAQKPDMNRAWDEWVDRANPPQRACIGVTLEDRDLVEILVTAAL